MLSAVDMALVVLLAEKGEIARLALERFERDLARVCMSLFVGGKWWLEGHMTSQRPHFKIFCVLRRVTWWRFRTVFWIRSEEESAMRGPVSGR